jgi:hypothetical protein
MVVGTPALYLQCPAFESRPVDHVLTTQFSSVLLPGLHNDRFFGWHASFLYP